MTRLMEIGNMSSELDCGLRQLLKSAFVDAIKEAAPQLRELVNKPPHREAVDAPRLLRPRDAAAALCISEKSLCNLTKDGVIPCVRINRLVRYSADGLR